MLTEEEMNAAREVVKSLADLAGKVADRAKNKAEVPALIGALMGFIQAALQDEFQKRNETEAKASSASRP